MLNDTRRLAEYERLRRDFNDLQRRYLGALRAEDRDARLALREELTAMRERLRAWHRYGRG
jgi:hypothetical protein